MTYTNEMTLTISAKSQNESYARVAVAAFVAQLDPTVSEINDIKTAVSEAVTNSIIHGYNNNGGEILIKTKINELMKYIYIEVIDYGIGIENIEQAKTVLFTSKPEMDRSGMGFTVMEEFMDSVKVISAINEGTKIIMTKSFIGNVEN